MRREKGENHGNPTTQSGSLPSLVIDTRAWHECQQTTRGNQTLSNNALLAVIPTGDELSGSHPNQERFPKHLKGF